MAIDVMVANVHVERYPSIYHQGRTLIVVPKKISRLVPKPRRLPWKRIIHKIVDDEYFWIEEERSISSERKARSNGYKTKLIKKNHYTLPTMLSERKAVKKVICKHLT